MDNKTAIKVMLCEMVVKAEKVKTEAEINTLTSDIADRIEKLFMPTVSGSLEEHKQVIRDLMETYIINLDENGSPKSSITDIMKLIDRAVKLVGDN